MATFIVTEQSATGAGSLAAAIAAAAASAGPDRIVFAADVKNIVTSGTLAIDSNLVIDGDRNNDGVADVTISSDIDVDGTGNHTLFALGTGANVTFDGLVFTKGFDAGSSAGDIAAGAIINNGTATIKNSQFTDNHAAGWVGQNGAWGTSTNLTGGNGTDGGAAAGAILNRGAMSIQNTVFSENSGIGGNGGAGGNGAYIPGEPPFGIETGGSGGDGANGGFGAGAIVNFTGGTLTLSGVEFDDNTGVAGNGGNGGDGYRVGLSSAATGGSGGAAGHGSATILDFGTMSGTASVSGGAFSGAIGGERGTPPPDFDDTPYVRPDGIGGLQPTRIGTTGNDTRTGLAISEIFGGVSGNDAFIASAGNDVFNGGAGTDTVVFTAVAAGVSFDLSSVAAQFIRIGNLAVVGVENATGGSGNDSLTGDAAANTLNGGAGNDTLDGALGADLLIGGGGNDTFYVSDAGDVVVEVAGGGMDKVLADVDYVLSADASVEALATRNAAGNSATTLTGNDFAQSITGNKGINTLYGLGGNDTLNGGDDLSVDTLYGGTGDDIFRVYTNSDRVRENTGEGFDRVFASRDFTLFAPAEIEMLTTSSSTGKDAIVLVGNAFTQTIIGNAGDNVLNSAGGGDTLRGLGGNDLYHVNSDDTVIENANGGTDTVNAHSNYVLAADAHVEVLQSNDPGGTFARDLTGNAFAQTIIGGAGANRLHDGGKGGADILRGLGGDDTYVVYNAGDVIEDTAGNDRVLAGVSFALKAGVTVEMLTTTSGSGKGAINLTGNELSQEIVGNAGNNLLSSGAVGGVDMLRGLGGNDIYRVYNAGDIVVEEASQGSADRVMSSDSYTLGAGVYVEMLTTNSSTATTSINLTGNALHQTITGNAGANILSDGGAGKADTMIGLSGNDTYRVYNAGDVIQEAASQGTADRVIAAVDYKLGAGVYVESLTTNGSSGKSAIDLTGNELAQEILGNAGDNRIEGREGSDTLRGFGGDDTFVFNTKLGASNIDTILDFNVADDRFLMSDAVFKALSPGILSAAAFQANTTGLAADATDRIVYETDTGKLFYDADGTGSTAGIHFATITAGLGLTNADFSVA